MGMIIRKAPRIRYSEVTPKHLYLNRRRFLSALPAAGALLSTAFADGKLGNLVKSPLSTTGEQITPLKYVSTYNNYYEFGTDKIRTRGERPYAQALALVGQGRRRWSTSPRSSISKRSRSWLRSKSASTGIAASRRGRSSCPGSAFP